VLDILINRAVYTKSVSEKNVIRDIRNIIGLLDVEALCVSMQKTSQFKTQCKGDISHAFETAKITVFYPTVCKIPDVPLQNELLCWIFVVRGDNWPTDINQPTES